MVKKKSKEPVTLSGGDTVSSQFDNIFKTIFGDVSEANAAVPSLFCDSNPFKRKPLESVEDSKKSDSLTSDTVELKQRKRKGEEEVQNPSLGSIEEATETLKEKKRKTLENQNLGSSLSNVESSDFDAKCLKGQDVKKKKRKSDELEKEYEERKYGTVAVEAVAEEVVVGQKRKKAEDDGVIALVPKEGFDDESKLLRTVFVGNLPIKVKKKVLIKEFSNFGEIESVRIRSVPLSDVSFL